MNWKELGSSRHGLMDILSRYFYKVTEENHRNFSQDSTCPAEIRTQHLLNMNLERYRYADASGVTSRILVNLDKYLRGNYSLHLQGRMMSSRARVAIDGAWICNWIYWIPISRNYY
jgi:hypothetical protein